MTHIMTARIKQRSVIITLLDLKNAFGELHHNLIYEVLQYHHLPREISDLIQSLYTNFQTSTITEHFSTPFITIGRGVLQGDSLSPLLFNMSFNTFIQHIKSEKYSQFGFWKFNKTGIPCNPIHWFQFADDAAVISSQEKENQILLNRFSVWCQWANMIIMVSYHRQYSWLYSFNIIPVFKLNPIFNIYFIQRISIVDVISDIKHLYYSTHFDR